MACREFLYEILLSWILDFIVNNSIKCCVHNTINRFGSFTFAALQNRQQVESATVHEPKWKSRANLEWKWSWWKCFIALNSPKNVCSLETINWIICVHWIDLCLKLIIIYFESICLALEMNEEQNWHFNFNDKEFPLFSIQREHSLLELFLRRNNWNEFWKSRIGPFGSENLSKFNPIVVYISYIINWNEFHSMCNMKCLLRHNV